MLKQICEQVVYFPRQEPILNIVTQFIFIAYKNFMHCYFN